MAMGFGKWRSRGVSGLPALGPSVSPGQGPRVSSSLHTVGLPFPTLWPCQCRGGPWAACLRPHAASFLHMALWAVVLLLNTPLQALPTLPAGLDPLRVHPPTRSADIWALLSARHRREAGQTRSLPCGASEDAAPTLPQWVLSRAPGGAARGRRGYAGFLDQGQECHGSWAGQAGRRWEQRMGQSYGGLWGTENLEKFLEAVAAVVSGMWAKPWVTGHVLSRSLGRTC